MPDTLRAAVIFPVGMIALVILVFTVAPCTARFVFANLLALTMRPGKRYNGWRWHVIRRYVYDRDRNECQECGYSFRQLDCHHKRAVALGGSHYTTNLETLCHRCHKRRHPENRSM